MQMSIRCAMSDIVQITEQSAEMNCKLSVKLAFSNDFFLNRVQDRKRCLMKSGSTLFFEGEMEGHEPLPVGRVSRNLDLLPACFHATVAGLIRGSGFRSLRCLEDQIRFFRSETKLSMELIAILLDTPVSTMHRYLRPKAPPGTPQATDTEAKAKYGPNSALTIKQEEQVLDWILRRQKEQNCTCPLEVREYAARLKNDGQGTALNLKDHLSRDWWHKFKLRHKDVIGVRVATSREQARTRCTENDVREYFRKMASILEKVKSLKQIINMDETGFHSRIDRDCRQKCVFHKKCETHVTFCQEAASTTLSMMVSIAADGQVLQPMFVCREDARFNSVELKSVKEFIRVSKSPKIIIIQKDTQLRLI